MGNQISGSKISEQYLLPVIFAIVLLLILYAVFTGDNCNETSELETTRTSMKNGKIVNRDWFSLEVSEINRNTAREYNIPSNTQGIVITEIEGAEDVKMKLQEGDVISGINGKKIRNIRDFRKASRNFNPAEGLFLDINRNSYPIYVTIPGTNSVSNPQFEQYQNQQPFELTEIAPYFGKDIDPGGIQLPDGVISNEIENWINNNFGSDYYACLTCGTLVPHNDMTKNKTISCPNCWQKMVLK